MKRTLQNLVRGIFSKHDVQVERARRYSSVEALEQRVFLSSTVMATVVDGSLNIRGNAAASAIILDQAGLTANQVRVSGINGTAINNLADPVVLSGVTRGVFIRMGGTTDSVTMSNLNLSGSVSVNDRGGSNTLALNNVKVAASLNVLNQSKLPSTTTISNTTVGKSLNIAPGSGSETVVLQGVQVQRSTQFVSGGGADTLTIDDSTFNGPVRLNTGKGADVLHIDANGDPLGSATAFNSVVRITMGAGNDIMQLGVAGQSGNRATFAKKAFFGGGPNFDIIRNLDSSTYGKARFFIENFESTAPAPDTTAPTVSSTAPANGTIDVALNQGISATFSEPMNPATISASTVAIVDNTGAAVAGSIAYVGTTMIFTPAADLAPNTTLTATITTGATDVAGNPLASNYVWSFTTGAAPDITAPTVSSTDPENNAMGIALNAGISATFSEAMNPLTINSANVTVTSTGSIPVSGTVAYAGTTMTFTPTIPLAVNTTYTVTVGAGVTDVAGNALANNYIWTFSTGATADTTAPTVTSTNPASNEMGVALNKKIAATFSEAMNPLTITTANVTVSTPGPVSVSGAVTYVGRTMTFTPSSPLASNTTYTATITGATDQAGNALASNYVWTFTTGATANTTAPTVISTNPANLQTNVSINQTIAGTFSEAIDPTTIATNFTVTGPGGSPVVGSANYDSASQTATFTPSAALASNTTYTGKIAGGTSGAKDLAGNPLASNYVWSFTTGATPDTTAPTVLSTNPANLQTNVALNKMIAATFSEAINPQTIAANFSLKGPGNTVVNGSVTYNAPTDVATFTPLSNLAPNTMYTATIRGGTNGVKDLAGNRLANDQVWTFTTGTQIAQAPINLKSAGAFAILATSAVSGTGPTQINGDVGLNPGSTQGLPPSEVNGNIHVDDQTVVKAQSDLLAAYNDAVGRSTTSQSLPGNIGGLTFTPGLYTNSTSVLIQGAGPANNVTLDAQGDPNAIFIFQMGSTLTTGPGAQVILAGGAKASNIFWQVGTSATLDTTTIFKGNILASVTITVNGGSVVEGRLLGGSNSDGAVTVNASTVTVPAP